jgi:hypothetical protein
MGFSAQRFLSSSIAAVLIAGSLSFVGVTPASACASKVAITGTGTWNGEFMSSYQLNRCANEFVKVRIENWEQINSSIGYMRSAKTISYPPYGATSGSLRAACTGGTNKWYAIIKAWDVNGNLVIESQFPSFTYNC